MFIAFTLCLLTAILYGNDIPFSKHEQASPLAQQWAAYVKRQTEGSTIRRNRLHDDPEQQKERDEEGCKQIVDELAKLKERALSEDEPKVLEQLELACRFIIQTFLRCNDKIDNSDATKNGLKILKLAAYIKLKQDPFWQLMQKKVMSMQQPTLSPTKTISYTATEFEHSLVTEETKKDHAIKILLHKIDTHDTEKSSLAPELVEELAKLLVRLKKSPEQILAIADNMRYPIGKTRIKSAREKKAIMLYNGAVASELKAHIRFTHIKDRQEYLEVEKLFGAVALLYLKAHDNGYPSALFEAEKIMNSDIMDTIISWKQNHHIDEPFGYYSKIWEQINIRKYGHMSQSSSGASSSV